MPDSVKFKTPDPGTTVTTSPTFTGSYTLSNSGDPHRILCRIVYPPNTLNNNLLVEAAATLDTPNPLDWTVTFSGLQEGLDATVTAELYVTPSSTEVLVDTDTLEDIDILDTVVGTLVTIVPLTSPIIPIP